MEKRALKFGLAALMMLTPLVAQEPEREHRMPPPPKNLKLLKAEELMPSMRAFKTALGVECSFCHVRGDFASDEKHEKLAARMMISMVGEINAKFPDGKMHVTCFTCHRGSTEPLTAPVAAAGAQPGL